MATLEPARSGPDTLKRVHIHFRTYFYTRWGQSLTLCGQGES